MTADLIKRLQAWFDKPTDADVLEAKITGMVGGLLIENERLSAELASMTADRDSWAEQAAQNAGYAAEFAKERDALSAELAEAKEDLEEGDALREKLSGLLTRTVSALRGEPPPLTLWSWHDVPELAAEARKDAERWRWARKHFRTMSLDMGGNHAYAATAPFGRIRGPSIDAAIDAALASEQQPASKQEGR